MSNFVAFSTYETQTKLFTGTFQTDGRSISLLFSTKKRQEAGDAELLEVIEAFSDDEEDIEEDGAELEEPNDEHLEGINF